jgi:aminoglycoside 6-adenylyltransferase
MMDLILAFARDRTDVRAVVMTGSRANPNATRDRFQDYDITYLVEDVTPYRQNWRIPAYFGDFMIVQTPDDMGDSEPVETSYAYLIQFKDGNRIDMTFRSKEDIAPILDDSLSLVLLDKHQLFNLPPPSLRSYLPVKPAAKQFADCCNEFWWVNPYVAKGLYRDEIPYAKGILDGPIRSELLQMLTWYIGVTTNFQVAIGLYGRYLKTHLPDDLWQLWERTYSDAQSDNIWESLLVAGELFRRAARISAQAFGFSYPEQEDAAVSAFVKSIRCSSGT